MFTTKRNIEKQIKDDVIKSGDKQSDSKVFDSTRIDALVNAGSGKRSEIRDISQVQDEQQKNNRYVDSNAIPMVLTKLTPDVAKAVIEYAQKMKQICVYNPTTTIIKLGVERVDTSSYEFLINANKIVVLPPFNFDHITYLQESIQAGFVVPIIFAYADINLMPSVSVIT